MDECGAVMPPPICLEQTAEGCTSVLPPILTPAAPVAQGAPPAAATVLPPLGVGEQSARSAGVLPNTGAQSGLEVMALAALTLLGGGLFLLLGARRRTS